jgi:hypothetical protein
METIKIHCPCGQNYSFEVEPLRGQMPGAVNCPACGADGTDAANAILTQRRTAQLKTPRASVIPPPIISEVKPARQLTEQEIHSGTVASNVARLEPDWKLVARTRPFMWIATVGLIVGGILGGWLAHPVLYFILPASAAWMVFGLYRELTAKLMSGDVCPAMVIPERPWRVAVFTDLSATGGFSPAIRIVDQSLGKMAGGAPAVGVRL